MDKPTVVQGGLPSSCRPPVEETEIPKLDSAAEGMEPR
jgi:hypothetical protein